jgi:dTDP-4-dehydrorhamnose reductase
MSKTLLITGGHGAFAKKLQQHNINNKLICLSKQEMDVTSIDEVDKFVKSIKPDILLHVGALTRPMSIHEKNPDKSIKNNIIGTSNVVLICMKYNIKIIYISTDFIYPGIEGNYSEKSSIYPVNKYAWSKLGGECAVRLYDNSLILRVAMAQVPYPHSKALVDMKKSLLPNDDVAKIIFKLLEQKGTINIGGEPDTVYNHVKKINPNIGKISLNDINDTNMPKDITMDITKMKKILNNEYK